MLWGTPLLTEEEAPTIWSSLKSSNAESQALVLVLEMSQGTGLPNPTSQREEEKGEAEGTSAREGGSWESARN